MVRLFLGVRYIWLRRKNEGIDVTKIRLLDGSVVIKVRVLQIEVRPINFHPFLSGFPLSLYYERFRFHSTPSR